MKKNIIVLVVISLFLIIQPCAAAVLPFWNDLPGFNTAAGSPPVLVDFDSTVVAPGGQVPIGVINGVTFLPLPPGALPFVIRASDSFTTPGGFSWFVPENKLFATSGENVLSPGGIELGPNDPLQNDDMVLLFNPPVKAVGFDLLFQSLDGSSYAVISVLDSGDITLFSAGIPITAAPGSTGGSNFMGFVSDSENIAKIVIDDIDGDTNNPDSNIGLDTLRAEQHVQFTCGDGLCDVGETCVTCEADCGSCPPVPEFPSMFLPATMIIGMLGAVLFIQRTRE